MNTLVLGGNGFIGSHLVDELLENGHAVRVLDRYEEHFRKPLDNVEYIMAEMGNRGMMEQALKGVDIVFHLANTTLPASSNEDPAFDVKSNLVETIYLLEQCVAHKIKKLVFLSSGGTVYGRPASIPVREDSPTNPECSYGIVKLTIEKYLILFNRLHGLDYVILRPANPYGERQNPDGIQGFIPVCLRRLSLGLPIVIWGTGDVVRDYLYIEDLVQAIVRAALLDSSVKVFNVGSGTGHSLNDILGFMQSVTEREMTVRYEDRRSYDIPKIYLDISRAQQHLKWSPKIGLMDGIARTWQFVRQLN